MRILGIILGWSLYWLPISCIDPCNSLSLCALVTEYKGGIRMLRRILLTAVIITALSSLFSPKSASADQRDFGRVWGGQYSDNDWERFYHYPYVFYPHNFYGNHYYRSSESLYHRYPQEMRVPVYNKKWHNYYPAGRRYHSGHHFMLDVF